MSKTNQSDVRVQTTGVVWGLATGMMGMSIPLVAIAGEVALVLPALVLMGASVGTVAVWKFGGTSLNSPSLAPSTRPPNQLEERVANLETIALRSEETLKARFLQLEQPETVAKGRGEVK